MKSLALPLFAALALQLAPRVLAQAPNAPVDPNTVPTGDLKAFQTAPKGVVAPAPPSQRQVGIAYTTWHQNRNWTSVWGTPQLGFYRSDDRAVIRQHATWLADAGVDFVFIDWSNNSTYAHDPLANRSDFETIESSTFVIFDEFAKMRAEGKKTPSISIFLGYPDVPLAILNGMLDRKADQVWNQFVANPNYRPLVQTYLGKPLLVVYASTPTPYPNGAPPWDDRRFTVRHMTGFITQQPTLITRDLVSKFGYWSWEDRGPQTYPIFDGAPEAMNIVATWRHDPEAPAPGRRNGETFRAEWKRAREIGPRFALVVSWNEWVKGEQPSVEISKDIEPSREFGRQYLDILKDEIAKFKRGE